MTRSIGILVFDDVEILDACGPYEVFSVANRIARSQGEPHPFRVALINAQDRPVARARGGLRLGCDVSVREDPQCDVILVPGGVVDAVRADSDVLFWLQEARSSAELIAAVCTGAFVLGAAGLLDGRPVTTHWADIEALATEFPTLDVVTGVRFIDHGDIATSAGISAALDLSLHLVQRFAGVDLAAATARQLDYGVSPGSAPVWTTSSAT